MSEKEYIYRSVPLEVMDVQLFTETHVSGGGGSVDTNAFTGRVSGRTASIRSTNMTYQQVRMKQLANNSGVEVMRSILLDGVAVAAGQKLLAVYFEGTGGKKSEIAYINKSTNRFWHMNPLHESSLGNVLIIAGVIAAIYGVLGEMFGLLVVGFLCLIPGILLHKSNVKNGKTNKVRAEVIEKFMKSDSNVARRQVDDSLIFAVEEPSVYT